MRVASQKNCKRLNFILFLNLYNNTRLLLNTCTYFYFISFLSFQLLTEKLFEKEFGMWIELENGKGSWFNPSINKTNEKNYSLVGLLMGLAVYNGVVLGKKVYFEYIFILFPFFFTDNFFLYISSFSFI